MTSYRITPLPLYYQQMKLDFLQGWEARGFKGYKSPWIPVCEANQSLIRRGDLTLDENGFERPHEIRRDWQVIKSRQVVVQVSPIFRDCFVWVDTLTQAAKKYLKGNPHAERYGEYTKLMEGILRSGKPIVQEVPFPLFHETSRKHARNIFTNGIDVIHVQSRKCMEFGAAFCTGIDFQSTLGKGNAKGAMVKFEAWKDTPPRMVNPINVEAFDRMTIFLQGFKRQYEQYPFYTYRTVCSELAASSISTGAYVFIYDSFEQYRPTEIIRT